MIEIPKNLTRVGRLDGHSGPVSAIACYEGDCSILSCSYDHTSILWDLETSTQVVTFSGHTGAVRDCMFAPGGRVCITAGDTSVRLWDR
jgi:WD40 repeat protein